jgi:MFS transporter, Spinster family, sphingosine-1-phosphate transporter
MMLGSIEATNGPATPSLLGDYYPVRKRNSIFGRFAVGTTFANVIAIILGGAIVSGVGWRATFLVWGIAGMLIGLLAFRTLREPQRGLQDALYRLEAEIAQLDHLDALELQALQHPDEADEILSTHPTVVARETAPAPGRATGDDDYRKLTLGGAVKQLVAIKSFRWFIASQAFAVLFISLLGVWAITFFRRYHGLSAAGASGVVSLLSFSLMLGAAHGGRIGDRLVNRGTPVARVKLIALAQLGFFLAQVAAWGTAQLAIAIPFFLISGYIIGFMGSAEGSGLSAVVVLDVIVPHLRGRAIAFRSVLMVSSVAIAPIILGVLSDTYGLRQALLMMAPVMVVAACCTLLGKRHWEGDFLHAQLESVRQAALESDDLEMQGALEAELLLIGAGDLAATEAVNEEQVGR